jgi:transcriptional regulator with XRE-family HTH domain
MRVQRNAASPRVLAVRPLVEADLELLRQPSKRVGLVRPLRDSHHNIARLLASGLKLSDIAQATGFSISRISLLRSDPSMVELIERYRAIATAEWRESIDHFAAQAVSNMVKAERMLADKLDDADAEGTTLPTRELIAIAADRMDRFGYGKKTANLNVNVDFAAKLEAAITRSKKVAAE